MQVGRRNVFSRVSPILLLLLSCGIMENMDDYQYLSSPNGWSGKTKFDDSHADTWFDIASASMTASRDPAANRATMERKVREIDIGYRFSIHKRIYLDLRINEIVSVYTWLSEEHTNAGWATVFGRSLPKSPLLSLDFGLQW